MPAVIGPVTAGLRHRGRNDSLLDQLGLLHGVDVEASADVPRDMAMQWPHAGVIGVVLNDDKARGGRRAGLKELHVPALRVGCMHNGAVPRANAFGQYVEVVSVQMHRVSGAGVIFDDDPYAVIGAEVVDVPLLTAVSTRLQDLPRTREATYGIIRVGSVAEVCEKQNGVAGLVSCHF